MSSHRHLLASGVMVAFLGGCSSSLPDPPPPPPPPSVYAHPDVTPPPPYNPNRLGTRRDQVVDDLFGQKVSDPFRWLENGSAAEVTAWTELQNQRTQKHLGAFKGRAEITSRLRELMAIGVVNAPVLRKVGRTTRYFWTARGSDQNQSVLLTRDGQGPPQVRVDPASLSKDGTTALDWWYPSWDGKRLAFGLSTHGSEESTLYILDLEATNNFPIPSPIHASVQLHGFQTEQVSTMLDIQKKVQSRMGDERYYRKIFFHVIGQPSGSDRLVFGEGREKTDSPSVVISPNGRWVVIRVHKSWSQSELFLIDRSHPQAEPVPVVTGVKALFNPEIHDNMLYIRTNEDAPRYKVVAVPPARATDRKAWTTVIAEGEDTLQDFSVLGSDLYVTWLRRAASRVSRHDLKGKLQEEIALPGLGAVDGVQGHETGGEALMTFTSFSTPPTVLRRDPTTGAVSTWDAVRAPFDPSSFQVSQRFATSKDGTKIPYFVLKKSSTPEDGTAPALLHGYGGFNISIRPELRRASLLFAEKGGVVVVANLRGGGEFGETWHRAGMREQKQNVFDDLFAVAEHVVQTKAASSQRLSFWGGSNGGLLAAVAAVQRPDLWRAIVSAVPLTDMIRFPRFLIAKLWTEEYGDPSKEDEFRWLYAYSPYHRVVRGAFYPAVLLTTAESDSRVDPLHARKMAAMLQESTASEAPILLRVETKAGHGAGKPVTKQVEELTDVYSFLFEQLMVQ